MKVLSVSFLWVVSSFLVSSVFAESERYRFATYNFWNLKDFLVSLSSHNRERATRVCDILRDQKDEGWDALFGQEIWREEDGRDILTDCGYQAIDRNLEVETGLVTFVRNDFSILDVRTEKFSVRGLPYIFNPDGEYAVRKGYLAIKVETPVGQTFWLINTHLIAWYGDKKNLRKMPRTYNGHREIQLRELWFFAKSLQKEDPEVPIVLAGDFNSGPEPLSKTPESWELIRKLFLELFQQVEYDSSSVETFSAKNDILKPNGDKQVKEGEGKIDHIFFTEPLKAIPESGHYVFDQKYDLGNGVTSYLSDHFGWEVELELEAE